MPLTAKAAPEISLGKTRYFHAYIRHIYIPAFLLKFRAFKVMAYLPNGYAYYAISVRRTSDLPPASFRFHLAVETLNVRLTLPLDGHVQDLHPRVLRHARRPQKK